jgi:hypothetical protein
MERATPFLIANRLLNRGILALKLELFPATDKVVALAKRRRVKVTVVEPQFWERYTPIPTIESVVDVCPLDQLLQDLDGGGARWKARANAWAVGDVKKLTQLVRPPPSQTSQCNGREEALATDATGTRIKQVWLAAMERSLANNNSTLAVVDASLLLSTDGLLDTLQSRGYEVVAP